MWSYWQGARGELSTSIFPLPLAWDSVIPSHHLLLLISLSTRRLTQAPALSAHVAACAAIPLTASLARGPAAATAATCIAAAAISTVSAAAAAQVRLIAVVEELQPLVSFVDEF